MRREALPWTWKITRGAQEKSVRVEPDGWSEGERLGPTSHLAALTDAQLIDRTTGKRLILGEEPGQQLHIVESTVAKDRDRAAEVRGDALVREQQRRDHPDDGVTTTHGDELPLVDESTDAGDFHVQVQGHIGEGEPVRDEFIEGIHGTRVPRPRTGAHPERAIGHGHHADRRHTPEPDRRVSVRTPRSSAS